MKKILFGMVVCALALAGCGSDTFFDEPEETIVHTPLENDPALEKLETNVGYYYGDKDGDLTRYEFAYRAAVVTRSRDFITGDDFVSDRYFINYYREEPEFVVISPMIRVRVENSEAKDKILKKYRGKLTLSDRSGQGEMPGGYYLYKFDCHLRTSEQALNLADEIYRRDDVTWAETNKYAPIHFDI